MTKIAINGYGRIGRNVLRALYEGERTDEIQIVAVNEAICEARPLEPPGDDQVEAGPAEAEKGGSSTGSSRTSPPS